MAKKFSTAQAMEFLGMDENGIKSLLDSRKLKSESAGGKTYISEDSLLRYRLAVMKGAPPRSNPDWSILDDKQYMTCLFDLIHLLNLDLSTRMEASLKKAVDNQDRLSIFISQKLENLKKILTSLTESGGVDRGDNGPLKERLDRLNELTPIRDNLEEVTDQIGSMESIITELNRFLGEEAETLKTIKNSALHGNESRPDQTDIKALIDGITEKMSEQNQLITSLVTRINYMESDLSRGLEKATGDLTGEITSSYEDRMEENKLIQHQIVNSLKDIQDRLTMNPPAESENFAPYLEKILEILEESREERGRIWEQLDMLADRLQDTTPRLGISSGDPRTLESQVIERLKEENTRISMQKDKILRENMEIRQELKNIQSGMKPDRRIQQMMAEMEDIQREKEELKHNLDEEKKEKSDMAQHLKKENRELSEALAMEKHQREKERMELEQLKAQLQKKKWWE